MAPIELVTIVLVLLGVLLLAASVILNRRQLQEIPDWLRGKWRLMVGLTHFFLAGYIVFLILHLLRIRFTTELLTSLIYLGGALFVLLVSQLLRSSFKEIYRGEEYLQLADANLLQRNQALEQEIEERKQMEEELIRYRERLEHLVADRTAELQLANDRLIQEKNKLEAVLAALGDGLTLQDTNFKILYQNAPHKERQGDHVGESCFKAYQGRDSVCPGCQLALCFTDGKVHRRETRAETTEGTIYMEVSASPLKDARGEIVGGVEVIRDVTEHKKLESQLRQSQKMEAIGSLAGGIAHDFNNLLTTIIGYSELSLLNLAEGDRHEEYVKAVLNAGKRAAALTGQLLAFSRKQVLEVKVVDLNDIVRSMGNLLTRLIGEQIELRLHVEAQHATITADPSQIEQVIMNLAVNARDAMPEGGTLIIETAEMMLDEAYARHHSGVQPGPHVLLMVSDTGEGFSEDIRQKIFEPFFTTKEKGKGTGLGLATVFGVVKQHKAHIYVYSEPEKGTTFKIYFPAAAGEADLLPQVEKRKMARGTETILVVEDEPSIRSLVAATLEPLGYQLLLAASGEEALEIAREGGRRIDLLLTDVIMRGMNGRDLADALNREQPEVKVIFMSGYTDNVIAHQGVLKPGITLLNKPLTPNQLTARIREVLDQK